MEFSWKKKKEGIKGINQGMIGGKKTKGKKKKRMNPIRPRILGAKFQGNSISSSSCNGHGRKSGNLLIPGWISVGKGGFSFILSQPEWENFPRIPIPRAFWVGNAVAAIPGFFWEYLGNAGQFQRGGIEEMLPWEEGASGTGTELTGARDLSRLSVLEENSWERQEKGGSVAGFFWEFFP